MIVKISTNKLIRYVLFVIISSIFFGFGFFANGYITAQFAKIELLSPFVETGELITRPLLAYSISNLQTRKYENNPIVLEEVLSNEDTYTSLLFSYQTLGKKMTGQINIPDNITANPIQERKVIIMLRGYVPPEIYKTGSGTANAAAVFAKAGYITIAPDFFGYGKSDPEPEDSWQTRFEKPITIIELLNSIEKNGIPLNLKTQRTNNSLDSDTAEVTRIGLWAHSNGGQIALTVLEILQKPIPTALWAPVTVPFPYSILYFSDELEDEGKEQRKWLSMFEENYDVLDFSHTAHLDSLTGPIQIQHGQADDAALIFWSQEFIKKIEIENEKREIILEQNKTATQSAINVLDPIDISLISYPNTNHNMVPNWDRAIQRDLQFFEKWLK